MISWNQDNTTVKLVGSRRRRNINVQSKSARHILYPQCQNLSSPFFFYSFARIFIPLFSYQFQQPSAPHSVFYRSLTARNHGHSLESGAVVHGCPRTGFGSQCDVWDFPPKNIGGHRRHEEAEACKLFLCLYLHSLLNKRNCVGGSFPMRRLL